MTWPPYLLLFTWRMEKNFSTQHLSLAALENDSWVSEVGIATRCPYFEFVWAYFSRFLVRWWRQTISPKRAAVLIFVTPLEISISKPIYYSRGKLDTCKNPSTDGIAILPCPVFIWSLCFVWQSLLAAASSFSSLQYLHGLHPPILDFYIKYIYQKSHLGLSRQKICETQS